MMMIGQTPTIATATVIAFDGSNQQPPLPYPTVHVPPYREAAGETWRFSSFFLPACQGYFHGPRPLDWLNWGLVRDGLCWMSLTPMEIESQLPGLGAAHGTVAVCGLGMGLISYAMAHQLEVDRVFIIERDPEVIALFKQFSGFDDWDVRDRVQIVQADAMDPALRTRLPSVDVLYADIWPYLRMDCMVPDMQKMLAAIPAPVCGYWGQELDMVDWAAAQGVAATDFAQEHIDAFRRAHSLPLLGPEQEPTYASLCRMAAANPGIGQTRKP